MAISAEIIENIRERVSIGDLVSETVPLKRSGRQLVGLCPFHSEKTPSFFVREEEGTFHCFGCGKGGDVFGFLMDSRGLSFKEAVVLLANRLGMQIDESEGETVEAKKNQRRKQELRLVVRSAQEVFSRILFQDAIGKKCLNYLGGRKISVETASRFSLGYALPTRASIGEHVLAELKKSEAISKAALSETRVFELLQELGLIKQRERDNQYFDTFRDRLIFPILRSDGVPLAFGGRLIGSETNAPKYLNTQESLIYHKRKVLYGLPQALPEVRKTRQALLVEGYMDVLSLSERGINDAVACCGTAVTVDHVATLKRFVDRVIVVFDGDEAGQKAAASCFPTFLNSGIEVSAVLLDAGEDPDSLALKNDETSLRKLLSERSQPIVDVFIDCLFELLGGAIGDKSPVVSGKVAEQFIENLRKVTNPVEREFLLRRAVDRIGVSAASLEMLLGKQKSRVSSKAVVPAKREEKSVPAMKLSSQEAIRATPTSTLIAPRSVPLSGYIRQLLVALVAEPTLAPNILRLSSLVDGSGFMEKLPDHVREFIIELSGMNIGSVAAVVNENSISDSPYRPIVLELLSKYGLAGNEILEEAMRQLRIGGAEYSRVALDAQGAQARQTLRQEIRGIRLSESKNEAKKDEVSLETLVQEKLKKQRQLQQLR